MRKTASNTCDEEQLKFRSEFIKGFWSASKEENDSDEKQEARRPSAKSASFSDEDVAQKSLSATIDDICKVCSTKVEANITNESTTDPSSPLGVPEFEGSSEMLQNNVAIGTSAPKTDQNTFKEGGKHEVSAKEMIKSTNNSLHATPRRQLSESVKGVLTKWKHDSDSMSLFNSSHFPPSANSDVIGSVSTKNSNPHDSLTSHSNIHTTAIDSNQTTSMAEAVSQVSSRFSAYLSGCASTLQPTFAVYSGGSAVGGADMRNTVESLISFICGEFVLRQELANSFAGRVRGLAQLRMAVTAHELRCLDALQRSLMNAFNKYLIVDDALPQFHQQFKFTFLDALKQDLRVELDSAIEKMNTDESLETSAIEENLMQVHDMFKHPEEELHQLSLHWCAPLFDMKLHQQEAGAQLHEARQRYALSQFRGALLERLHYLAERFQTKRDQLAFAHRNVLQREVAACRICVIWETLRNSATGHGQLMRELLRYADREVDYSKTVILNGEHANWNHYSLMAQMLLSIVRALQKLVIERFRHLKLSTTCGRNVAKCSAAALDSSALLLPETQAARKVAIRKMAYFCALIRCYAQNSQMHFSRTSKEEEELTSQRDNLNDDVEDLENVIEELQASHADEIESLRIQYEHQVKSLRERVEFEEQRRKKAQEELQTLNKMNDHSLETMKKTHAELMEEQKRHFEDEIDLLKKEHCAELEEEKEATRMALDAVQRSHEAELKSMTEKLRSLGATMSTCQPTTSGNDSTRSEAPSTRQSKILEQMTTELAHLSALYSAKCLENSQLDEKMSLLLADKENRSSSTDLEMQNRRLQRELRQKEATIEELRQRIAQLERKLAELGVDGMVNKNVIPIVDESPLVESSAVLADQQLTQAAAAAAAAISPSIAQQQSPRNRVINSAPPAPLTQTPSPPNNNNSSNQTIRFRRQQYLNSHKIASRRNDIRFHSNPAIPVMDAMPEYIVDEMRRSLAVPVSERRKFFETIAEYSHPF